MKITNRLYESDFEYIHKSLSKSYWAKSRTFAENQIAFKNSLAFVLSDDQGQRIGFARVVTDYTVFAYLGDVYIDEHYRGRGLGKFLINTILKDPKLCDVRQFILKTSNAHELYRKFGFTEIEANSQKIMERFHLPIISTP
jgi:ribosomal protein S18 acetylase RimI-like enzyme